MKTREKKQQQKSHVISEGDKWINNSILETKGYRIESKQSTFTSWNQNIKKS